MTNSTQEVEMMEIENNEMVVRLRFNCPLSDEEAARMGGVMAEEMEFADPEAGRYTKSGWGIGRARVVAVEQMLPGDLVGIENAEMLALRLAEADGAGLAVQAREGASRAELLEALLAEADPDPELVAIVVGRPPAP
jgi:hypothetical protein